MREPRIQKLQEIPVLLDIYGCLLTEHQKEELSLFYEEDFSLSEIAALHGSSRQAVHNLIERGESLLRQYEGLLHIAEKERQRNVLRQALLQAIERAGLSKQNKSEIEELLCQL